MRSGLFLNFIPFNSAFPHKREDKAAAATARPKSATPELNFSEENRTAGIDAKSASGCTPVKLVLEKIDSSHSSVELKKNTKQRA